MFQTNKVDLRQYEHRKLSSPILATLVGAQWVKAVGTLLADNNTYFSRRI